jgi:hypothetical protein
MARVYERKFDWDEAKQRRLAGASVRELAAEYGVSTSMVYYATNARAYARMRSYGAVWQRDGTCVDCGATCTRRAETRCVECATRLRATSVRPSELRCQTCRKWKPDKEFSRGVRRSRRGRHQNCRSCSTRLRQDYRDRHKIPCSNCGKPRLPKSEKNAGAKRAHLQDSGLCLDCFRESIRKVAA